jgi:thiamine biosynthesis lipoprotein
MLIFLLGTWCPAFAHGAMTPVAGPIKLTCAARNLEVSVTMAVWARDVTICAEAIQAGFAEIDRIENVFSTYRQGSVINQLNQFAAIKPITVSEEVIELLQWAGQISEKTRGAYDITIAAFKWQYGFGQGDYRVPNFLRLDQIKPVVNYKYIVLDQKAKKVMFKRLGVQIDPGDLLINYALNRVRMILKKHKVQAARVDMGGNIAVIGRRPDNRPWKVAIQNPRDSKRILVKIPWIKGKILQAGDYQRYFIRKGRRYHPILDSRTGAPQNHSMSAVLLLPEDPKIDLPASVLMQVPPKEALGLTGTIPHSECLIVDRERKIWLSPGWKKIVKDLDPGGGFSL